MSKKETGGPAFPYYGGAGWMGPGLTLREYAAIKLKVPDSGTDWLDEMIRQSQRDELAAKALQGICASCPGSEWTNKRLAAEAYELADAMWEARKS